MAIFGRRSSNLNPQPEQEPKVETPAPAAEKPLTRDEVALMLNEGFKAIAERIGAQPPQQVVIQQPQPRVVEDPGVSDEEIEQAILVGAGSAPKIRGFVESLVKREAAKLVREHINPLRDTGFSAIQTMVSRDAEQTLPFYKKFRKEIDAQVALLTPELQVNPLAIKQIHDAVVGANWQAVADEVAEAKTRQAAESANGGPRGSQVPGGRSGGPARGDDSYDPSLEDFGGKAAFRALDFKDGGTQSPDQFAQKLGYRNFAEYSKIMADVDKQYKS